MSKRKSPHHQFEILEQRIAPAGLLNEAGFKTGVAGTPLLLTAGQGLSTGGPGAGTYLLYIEKGTALVFTTDFNNNSQIDFNEITGISAGNGLRLISFVDINGDIVTNLRSDTRLTDSDNDPSNDDPDLGGDGRVLLPSVIEKIELRSLTTLDINDQNGIGTPGPDGVIPPDNFDVQARLALSSYSIHGNILAGGGLGLQSDPLSGLIIDDSGRSLQQTAFPGGTQTIDLYQQGFTSEIGSVKIGTAATDSLFSFGASVNDDVQGRITKFTPAPGKTGGGIFYVRAAVASSVFNIGSLESGAGGVGAGGGNIENITLNGDNAGGYKIIAGNGGDGGNGGNGGNIVNLSDLGSITGEVILQTGSGGRGATGIGGNGGQISFGTINLNGNVQLLLGNGGDGFTGGGTGASIGSGIVTTPASGHYFGMNLIGNAVDRGSGTPLVGDVIGTSIPLDFDGDGFGDFLYSTTDPNQLVVVLATGQQFSLSSPIKPESIVVGDFNGDGHQDIAAAAGDDGAYGGISVFLSRYEDRNLDGNLSQSEDLNKNGVDDLTGFDTPIHSTLPAMFSGDPLAGLLVGANQLFYRSGSPVGSITAGDFDGDGFTDIAVSARYFGSPANKEYQVLVVLKNDVENGKPTGQLYADFGIKAQAFNTPVLIIKDTTLDQVVIQGTRLGTDLATYDHSVVMVGVKGAKVISTVDNSSGSAAIIGSFALGQVDTDRLPPAGNNNHYSPADATISDFLVADIDGDGFADLGISTLGPTPDYLVLLAGDGMGNSKLVTFDDGLDPMGNPLSHTGNLSDNDPDNFGIAFKKGNGNSFKTGTPNVGIRLGPADANGLHHDIAVLNYGPGAGIDYEVESLHYEMTNIAGGTLTSLPNINLSLAAVDRTVIAWDRITFVVDDQSAVTWYVAEPFKANIPSRIDPFVVDASLNAPVVSEVLNSFSIFAGNGGDALIGKGGNGGSIGTGLISNTIDPITGFPPGSISITFALSNNASTYQGGSGGNGFSTGGRGGNVSGLVIRTPGGIGFTTITTIAGDGGFGVSGTGGNGGSIDQSSIQDGYNWYSGAGGRGKNGGNGGDIIGNGIPLFYDSEGGTLPFTLVTGAGGNGVRAGGRGGDVLDWHARMNVTQSVFYIFTGDGGQGAAGVGGRGGNINDVTPFSDINLLSSEIFMQAGGGGRGTTGGKGGSVSNFVERPSTIDNPSVVSILAGHGGAGTKGNGGAGGDLASIFLPSQGSTDTFIIPISPYSFDRFLAGNGGPSSGRIGGAGGTVSGLDVTAADGSMVIAAGAGGDGLKGGGRGGNVVNNTAGVGGSDFSKLLVIAGKGGDSTALAFNPNDGNPNQAKLVFGGKIGRAGDGGDISNFRQNLGVSTRVDLIAGNGGDTTHYGTITNKEKTFVGTGGSIKNINLVGNIGTLTDALGNVVPLQSYNDTGDANNDGRVDQTVAQFVEDVIRNGPGGALTDALGNVGIIVGAAGRLKTVQVNVGEPPVFNTLPSGSGVNGSLSFVTARNLVSAVAGSIDRIASITQVSGLKIGFQTPGGPFTPGVVGHDKGVIGVFEYPDKDGVVRIAPTFDGSLIDGAVVAKKFVTLPGYPALSGRIFTV